MTIPQRRKILEGGQFAQGQGLDQVFLTPDQSLEISPSSIRLVTHRSSDSSLTQEAPCVLPAAIIAGRQAGQGNTKEHTQRERQSREGWS